MYFVYAIYSSAFEKIYIGYSSNPEKRLISHNDPQNRGWTRKYRPWKLIFTHRHSSKTAALKREKQLKSAVSREFIWFLHLS